MCLPPSVDVGFGGDAECSDEANGALLQTFPIGLLLEVVEARRRAAAGIDKALEDEVSCRSCPILLTTATTVAGLCSGNDHFALLPAAGSSFGSASQAILVIQDDLSKRYRFSEDFP